MVRGLTGAPSTNWQMIGSGFIQAGIQRAELSGEQTRDTEIRSTLCLRARECQSLANATLLSINIRTIVIKTQTLTPAESNIINVLRRKVSGTSVSYDVGVNLCQVSQIANHRVMTSQTGGMKRHSAVSPSRSFSHDKSFCVVYTYL